MAKRSIRRPAANTPNWQEVRKDAERDAALTGSVLAPPKRGEYATNAPAPSSAAPVATQKADPLPSDTSPPAATVSPPASTVEPKTADTPLPAIAKPKERAGKTASTKDAETFHIRATVRPPEPGHSATYDQVAAKYGRAEALRLILKPALLAYEAAIASGSLNETPATYESKQPGVRVARAMSADGYDSARKLHDPLNLIGEQSRGSQICQSAVSLYLSQQDGDGRK